MSNIKTKIIIVAGLLFLQPMVSPGSFALAKRKKTPPKAFSFIAEGGKASQGECDGERKIPKLKQLKEFAKTGSYMGSEMLDPEIKGKANEEMWKHFYRAKATCNSILAKTPSSLETAVLTKAKPELPPDDSEESEDSDNSDSGNGAAQTEAPESE